MREQIGDYDVTVVDRRTGEEISFEKFLVQYLEDFTRKFRFQQCNTGTLAGMLELIPGAGPKVLGYLLSRKTAGNLITETNKQIADELNMNVNTVAPLMAKFVKAKYLKRVDRGIYMLNPSIMSFGGPSGHVNQKNWRKA